MSRFKFPVQVGYFGNAGGFQCGKHGQKRNLQPAFLDDIAPLTPEEACVKCARKKPHAGHEYVIQKDDAGRLEIWNLTLDISVRTGTEADLKKWLGWKD